MQQSIAGANLGLQQVWGNNINLLHGGTGYEEFGDDVTSGILTGDDINTCSFDPGPVNEGRSTEGRSSYNYSSQAERTIRNYTNSGSQRSSNEGSIEGSNQQFEVRNGKNTPVIQDHHTGDQILR